MAIMFGTDWTAAGFLGGHRRDVLRRTAAGLALALSGNARDAPGVVAAGVRNHPTFAPDEPEGRHAVAPNSDHYALADADAEAVWFLGCLALIKGIGSRTGGGLATVEFLHPPGFATVMHVHHTADEAFYVLAGGIRGVCGDQEWRASTGAFVWLPRGVPHGYSVVGTEPVRTLAITLPGGFDRFVAEAGEPAGERTLPPPVEPDAAQLEAAGAKYGIEIVGPPVRFTTP